MTANDIVVQVSSVSFGAVVEADISFDCKQTLRQLPSSGPGVNLNYWADNLNNVPTLQTNIGVRKSSHPAPTSEVCNGDQILFDGLSSCSFQVCCETQCRGVSRKCKSPHMHLPSSVETISAGL
jgi:hypothetical protein